MSKVRHLDGNYGYSMKMRCVLRADKDTLPLCQTEKAICIKGQHAFKKQLLSTPVGNSV